MSDIENNIENAVKSLEGKLSIRIGFFDKLFKEDDWSFIIKSHAIVEAAVSSLLTKFVGIDSLIDVFSRIELSNKSHGKVTFLKHMNLLEKEERRFISALSEIRNKLVHNIKEVDFSLSQYVSELGTEQRHNFINNFGYCYLYENKHGNKKVKSPDEVIANPKRSIWLSLKYLLAIISMQIETSEHQIKYRVAQDKIYKMEQKLNKLKPET